MTCVFLFLCFSITIKNGRRSNVIETMQNLGVVQSFFDRSQGAPSNVQLSSSYGKRKCPEASLGVQVLDFS
jgi:hypothetical protein